MNTEQQRKIDDIIIHWETSLPIRISHEDFNFAVGLVRKGPQYDLTKAETGRINSIRTNFK